jgi:hypothetical protein
LRFLPQGWLKILPLLSLASLILAGASQASGPPPPIDAYWRRVQETQSLVAGLGDVPTEDERNLLLAAADQFEAMAELTLSDGTVIPIDHSFLVSHLRADPPDLAQLGGLLSALLAARDTWPQVDLSSLDHTALDRILARSEFQWREEQPSPLAEWWRQLQDRFWQLLTRLLPDEVQVPLASDVLTVLGILLLILVLVYALKGWLAGFVAETEVDLAAETDGEHLSAATALKQAQILSEGGDYRTAVRYLYLSSLLLLEEQGLLRYDRSLTNREYLRNLAHRPQLATVFREIVEVFDRVWYGYQSLDRTAYAQYAARVADLRRLR